MLWLITHIGTLILAGWAVLASGRVDHPTAEDIVAALRRYHAGDSWAFFAELRVGTGYDRAVDAEQRLDAWAMALWPSERYQRIAYEVKVSRSDFLAELQKPRKRRRALSTASTLSPKKSPGPTASRWSVAG